MKVSRLFAKLDLKDDIEFMGSRYRISTVLLKYPAYTLDFEKGEPKIREMYFESMIFKYQEDGELVYDGEYCMRYPNKRNAVKGHYQILDWMTRMNKASREYWRSKHDCRKDV